MMKLSCSLSSSSESTCCCRHVTAVSSRQSGTGSSPSDQALTRAIKFSSWHIISSDDPLIMSRYCVDGTSLPFTVTRILRPDLTVTDAYTTWTKSLNCSRYTTKAPSITAQRKPSGTVVSDDSLSINSPGVRDSTLSLAVKVSSRLTNISVSCSRQPHADARAADWRGVVAGDDK